MIYFLMSLWILVIIIPIGMLRAFALSCLWRWFIVPLGVIDIGIVHAWGLFLLIALFNGVGDEDVKEPFKRLAQLTAQPITALAIGYILHII